MSDEHESNVVDLKTRNKMLADQILEVIQSGGFDDRIEAIAREVKSRQQILKLRMLVDLHVGDHVFISQSCRPKMLAGAVVELVEAMPDGKYKVRLTSTYSPKWRYGNIITVPQSLIAGKV